MAVSFDPKQETYNLKTSNSVFSSVELEIRAIISFKVISWYEVTLLLSVESIVLWHPRAGLSKYSQLQLSVVNGKILKNHTANPRS